MSQAAAHPTPPSIPVPDPQAMKHFTMEGWSKNVERLIEQNNPRNNFITRFIAYFIRRKTPPNLRSKIRVEVYMNKVKASPENRLRLLIQLVEGTTMEAENLVPLLVPLETLIKRRRLFGFLTTKSQEQMDRIVSAGDALIDSIVEVKKKALEEVNNGLVKVSDAQFTWLMLLWEDVEFRVENYLGRKELLLKACHGGPTRAIPWEGILSLVGAFTAILMILYFMISIDPEVMANAYQIN